jgi:hypothetical protein
MILRSSRSRLLMLTVFVAALGMAQPVAASTRVDATGTVGAYTYTDTMAHPGALGLYKYNAEDGFGWLKRFYVNPPKMKAVAGMNSQTVGWLYNVQRKICGFGGCGQWQVTYTSPEFTAITDDSHSPSWGQDSVKVTVPCGHNCADAGAVYRINVKMMWHRANGSVMGTAKHRIYYYGKQLDIGGSGVSEGRAPDSWSPDWD